jgi:hypothetical protein
MGGAIKIWDSTVQDGETQMRQPQMPRMEIRGLFRSSLRFSALYLFNEECRQPIFGSEVPHLIAPVLWRSDQAPGASGPVGSSGVLCIMCITSIPKSRRISRKAAPETAAPRDRGAVFSKVTRILWLPEARGTV